MRKEEVLIIASPYDGERLRRVFDQIGRQAHVTDGGPTTEAALANGRRLIVLSVRATDPARLRWLDRLMASPRQVLVVADAGQLLPEGIPRIQRPIDPAELADALDHLATELPERPRNPIPPSLPRALPRAIPGSPSRTRILALAALARESDYFTLLGLPRHTDSTAVLQAYEAIRAEIELADLGELGRELRGELVEIHESIDEARLVLDNEALRLAYRRALEQPIERSFEG